MWGVARVTCLVIHKRRSFIGVPSTIYSVSANRLRIIPRPCDGVRETSATRQDLCVVQCVIRPGRLQTVVGDDARRQHLRVASIHLDRARHDVSRCKGRFGVATKEDSSSREPE